VDQDLSSTEKERRRFLELATRLGMVSPVIILALAHPSYAASSGGFNAGLGNGTEGGDPGNSGNTPAATVDAD
jgi:hypothetical protein